MIPDAPGLQQLIEKWRGRAALRKEEARRFNCSPSTEYWTFTQCADELESFLEASAASPEVRTKAVAELLDSLPVDYDWNADQLYLTRLEGALARLRPAQAATAPDFRHLASAMKKMLPPALLAEVVAHLRPADTVRGIPSGRG